MSADTWEELTWALAATWEELTRALAAGRVPAPLELRARVDLTTNRP
ncbi:hypothetical protein O7635_26680 [Asanoa sp. WMMD1127]|nr:hypothetical protein [Asanoa sp. WMMD1127]MDG4825449.1 hypothetical protein [Asanoa sp. WMMD1127]